MFQDTWVKVYPFLMPRCFNLLWRGTLKFLPVNMPCRQRRGYRWLYPALTSALGWGWVVNATLRWSCTSGILRARKRTCFCRNMPVSRISWSFEENLTSYTFSATCRGGRSLGDLPSRTLYLYRTNAWSNFRAVSMLRDLLLRITATKLPLYILTEFCLLEHTVPYHLEMQWRKPSRTQQGLCFRAGQWNANSATELYNALHRVAQFSATKLGVFCHSVYSAWQLLGGPSTHTCRRNKSAALEDWTVPFTHTTMAQCQPRRNSEEDGFRIQYVKMSLRVRAFLTDEAYVLAFWFSFQRT